MYWTKVATGFSTLYQYVLDESYNWFLYFIPICTGCKVQLVSLLYTNMYWTKTATGFSTLYQYVLLLIQIEIKFVL